MRNSSSISFLMRFSGGSIYNKRKYNVSIYYSLLIGLSGAIVVIGARVFVVKCSHHGVMHTLHIGLTLLALPQLHGKYVASLCEQCNLFLIFYLFPT